MCVKICKSNNFNILEDVFLQYFMNTVYEWQCRHSSGIGDFLEFWDKKKDKLAVQITGDLDCVQIMTIHKAKGLEWDSVVIADFNDGMFPHKRSNNIQEELHILYVAITRAKRNLVFVCNDNGIESPFLEAMKDTVVKADYEINKCA